MELVAAMKSDAELSEIPVAVISTEGSETRIQDLLRRGIAGYLRKPCKPEDIRDLLHKTLGEWK